MSPLKAIDSLLDRITMYRLTLYFLIALVLAAMGLAWAGQLHMQPLDIGFSAALLVIMARVTNGVFAWVYETPANVESSYITALILTLIITPATSVHGIVFPLAAAGLAIASKFILTGRGQHIFNPAAVAVVLTALGPGESASWWIGSLPLLPFVAVGGLLLVRKLRRIQMVASFFAAALTVSLLLGGDLQKALIHSSLLFLGFVMLTEPLTAPPTHRKRLAYAALVGALFPPQLHIASLYSTPELALVAGNLFAYAVSPRVRRILHLHQRLRLAPDIADFVFRPEQPFDYRPGQYLEWTLSHKDADSRGNRRYFTLASSPTEPELRIGVKFYPRGSSFKRALAQLDDATPLAAANLGGDFVLPTDPQRKLAFIAGGIGVTPYRSMIKYLLDTNQPRDITLLYSEKSREELVYTDIFEAARQQLGINPVYTLTDPLPDEAAWSGRTGFIDTAMITEAIPDYRERWFYVSGSHQMVTAMKSTLRQMGVPRSHIKTDLFTGYA